MDPGDHAAYGSTGQLDRRDVDGHDLARLLDHRELIGPQAPVRPGRHGHDGVAPTVRGSSGEFDGVAGEVTDLLLGELDDLATVDREAVAHLVGLCHTRIAMIRTSDTDGAKWASDLHRRNGYLQGLERHGLPHDPDLVVTAPYGVDAGAAGMERLLALPDPPTAFFCVTDPGALLVVRELVRHGRSVPGDVSVVGYDDTYAAVPGPVELTTVNTPLPEIARLGMSTLLGIGEGTEPVSHHVQLATALVTRETTAPPGR